MRAQLNEHPIPLRERHSTTMFVYCLLHGLLGTVQMSFQLANSLVSIEQYQGYEIHRCLTWQKTTHRWRSSSINDLEGSLSSSQIERSIVPLFNPWKPKMPFSWLFRSKTTQVGLQTSINHLCLAVSLWVISHALPQCCTLESKHFTPEFAQKHRITITNNGFGNSMQFSHIQDKYFHHCMINAGVF